MLSDLPRRIGATNQERGRDDALGRLSEPVGQTFPSVRAVPRGDDARGAIRLRETELPSTRCLDVRNRTHTFLDLPARLIHALDCLPVAVCGRCRASRPCSAERLSPEKLWDLARIGDAAVSPDGKQLAYLVTRFDLAKNEGTTSLLLQPLAERLQPGGQRATAFDTPLVTAKARVLLKDIKGLGSLAWLNHPSGPKLVYIAPAKVEEDTGSPTRKRRRPARKPTRGRRQDDASEEKPQAWMIGPDGGEPTQLTRVKDGIGNLKAVALG